MYLMLLSEATYKKKKKRDNQGALFISSNSATCKTVHTFSIQIIYSYILYFYYSMDYLNYYGHLCSLIQYLVKARFSTGGASLKKKESANYLTHLVKTGMNHSLRFSPNTCSKFLRIPTLKPFLSGPLTKTGAEKASRQWKNNCGSKYAFMLQSFTKGLHSQHKSSSQQIIYKSFRTWESSSMSRTKGVFW